MGSLLYKEKNVQSNPPVTQRRARLFHELEANRSRQGHPGTTWEQS